MLFLAYFPSKVGQELLEKIQQIIDEMNKV